MYDCIYTLKIFWGRGFEFFHLEMGREWCEGFNQGSKKEEKKKSKK
ncbi:MAG: hypothetical protein Pars93KO_28410 [Parasphingorhabdus sp.]